MHVALQALVALAAAVAGAYGVIYTARAARGTSEHQVTIDAAVQRDQNAIEGYDRLTLRLEAEVGQLHEDVVALRAEVRELRGEVAAAQKWRSIAVEFIRQLLADLEGMGAPKRPIPRELDL